MKWQDYYEKFYDWAESTQLNRISSLVEFSSIDEVIEIAENFDEKGASKLINQACSQGVCFNAEQMIKVCEYVNKGTLIALIQQCKERLTAEQIEYLVDYSLLGEDEIVKLLPYPVPVNSYDEEAYDDTDIEIDMPKPQKPDFFAAVGLALIGSEILDVIFDDDDD